MSRIQLISTSLIAAIPAWALLVVLGMNGLQHIGNMGFKLVAAFSTALLFGLITAFIPVGLAVTTMMANKKQKAEDATAARESGDEEGEAFEGDEESAVATATEESSDDLMGEDFFDDQEEGFEDFIQETAEDASTDEEEEVVVSETLGEDDFPAADETMDSFDAFDEDESAEVSVEDTDDFDVTEEADSMDTADAIATTDDFDLDEVEVEADAVAVTADFDLGDIQDEAEKIATEEFSLADDEEAEPAVVVEDSSEEIVVSETLEGDEFPTYDDESADLFDDSDDEDTGEIVITDSADAIATTDDFELGLEEEADTNVPLENDSSEDNQATIADMELAKPEGEPEQTEAMFNLSEEAEAASDEQSNEAEDEEEIDLDFDFFDDDEDDQKK